MLKWLFSLLFILSAESTTVLPADIIDCQGQVRKGAAKEVSQAPQTGHPMGTSSVAPVSIFEIYNPSLTTLSDAA